MKKRDYYSVRIGKVIPNEVVDLKVIKKLFLVIYEKLADEGYFDKYFGFNCYDEGYIKGELNYDLETILLISLKKENLYPINERIADYDEDDLFDIIEFLHDHCSKGIDGTYHSWNNGCCHYTEFSDEEGRSCFRKEINLILKDYENGYELSKEGEILQLAGSGLSNLFKADIPTNDKKNVKNKIENAILKFRRYKSTLSDRQDAIRSLVDVLEFLRPQAKELLNSKDESDLFNIANNFAIRHHNKNQKSNYDTNIWHSWMFYFYLSTIYALLHIIKRKNSKE